MRYLVEGLGHSALILEFCIAFDIILICLTGDCFISKLKAAYSVTMNIFRKILFSF